MNILIANDKTEQVQKLRKFINQFDKSINIVGVPSNLTETKNYLDQLDIDLAFSSTRLADGSIFELFNNAPINIPFVFTSNSEIDAFKAFKVDGLDYLLEPISYQDVTCALEKALKNHMQVSNKENSNFPVYKKRFLVKYGDKMQVKNVEDISFFYADGKMVYFFTRSTGRKYIAEYTLDELEKNLLDPECFFRINRKYIVHINTIEEVRTYANSRLKLTLNPLSENDMIVSRDKVSSFKNWLNL
jgi:DNA-binding LytR/AlgR family response regulator